MQKNALLEIQKKLIGTRTEPITATEIYTVFQSNITTETNLIIYKALKQNIINPDITILQIIPRTVNESYLIAIAFCIRYGTNSNMYVKTNNLGTIHILAYIYYILTNKIDTIIIDTIILMFLIKGSRVSMTVFESDTETRTVLQWLNEQGYNTILNRISVGNISEIKQQVDPQTLTTLSLLLNDKTLVVNPYTDQDLFIAIKDFADIDTIPLNKVKIIIDYKSLDDSVNYLNEDAFTKLILAGQLPSYILINKIIIMLRLYRNSNYPIPAQSLQQMLIIAISNGVQLDQEQYNIISALGVDLLGLVNKEYNIPYWKKACKNKNEAVTPGLRNLAISLDIDPELNQNAICATIDTYSKMDKEALKKAAYRRQQLRLNSNLGKANEFIDDRVPTLVCRNKALLPEDPFNYNDLAAYRDDQGAVWCFTPDMIPSLKETGLNPYNSTKLPLSFKNTLNNNYHTGVFAQALDNLNQPDVINKTNQEALNNLIRLASINGVSTITINNLTKEQMMIALGAIGINIDLNTLSTPHALLTTAIIISQINYDTTPFFDVIKMNNNYLV